MHKPLSILLLSAALALPVAALTLTQLSAPICRLQVIPDYTLGFAYRAVLRPAPGCGETQVLRVRKSSTTSVKRNGAPYQPIKPEVGAWDLGKTVNTVPLSERWTLNSWRWEWYDPAVWNPRTNAKGRWVAGEVLRAAP